MGNTVVHVHSIHTNEGNMAMKEHKSYLKDQLINNSTLVLNDIEASLQHHLGHYFQWEWRSVVGDNPHEPPMWSLHIYVERREDDTTDE